MKQVFKEGSDEQKDFEKCVQMYDSFQKIISKQIDCSNPTEIIKHLTEITGILGMGANCKAKLDILTDKLSMKKMMNIKTEDMSATEKKVILAYEIGDCSFYNVVMELLIKEAHYKIEIMRTSLSYCKSELSLG
jgi:hypothetical protein